jgi:hypothetical protein
MRFFPGEDVIFLIALPGVGNEGIRCSVLPALTAGDELIGVLGGASQLAR